jgi:hypothetical protein
MKMIGIGRFLLKQKPFLNQLITSFSILCFYLKSQKKAHVRFAAVVGIDPAEPQTIPATIGKRDSIKKRLKEIVHGINAFYGGSKPFCCPRNDFDATPFAV